MADPAANSAEIRDNNRESFIRWQQVTINERGKTINLFLGMSFATLGFVINELTKSDFHFRFCCDRFLIIVGTFLLLLNIVTLILLVLNRLKDFRLTTEISKKRECSDSSVITSLKKESECTGKVTHNLFILSLVLFTCAESLIVLVFIINVIDKF
jgi:hypothetical protein